MVPEINSRLEAFAKEEGIAYINLFHYLQRREQMYYAVS